MQRKVPLISYSPLLTGFASLSGGPGLSRNLHCRIPKRGTFLPNDDTLTFPPHWM